MKDDYKLQELIDFLEESTEESWKTDTVRSKDGKTNCVYGHIYAFGAGGYDKDGGIPACDFFEEVWATTYMLYPVNDGEDPRYTQSTPKQRVLAYLKDLRDGKEKNTRELWAEIELELANLNK